MDGAAVVSAALTVEGRVAPSTTSGLLRVGGGQPTLFATGSVLEVDVGTASSDEFRSPTGTIDVANGARLRIRPSDAVFETGKARGIRAGLARCPDAEFVYILNPDAIVGPGSIKALVAHLRAHPEVADNLTYRELYNHLLATWRPLGGGTDAPRRRWWRRMGIPVARS